MPKANMSKSNLENGQARIKAEKIFTDREAPRESFWKSYEEIANDMENYKVLTYYGIGGIGKTTLVGKLIQEMNEKKAKYVSINFEHYESLSKILILRDLGNKLFKLDKNRFKFYRFRFAMKRYAEETGQSLEIKNDNSSFLTNNPLLELGMDLSQNVPDLIEKLPIISTISKAITILDKSREIIKNKIDTRNMKKSLIEIQILEIAQIVKNIEKYFYEDLAEAMLNSKEPLVILLDTYEKFADSFCNSEYKSSEEWLKSIVSKPQGILWVITGRERIKWEEEFEAEQHLLENLSIKDANEFLITAGVDKELTEKIYELTAGNPVFLDVCVDRYVDLINNGKVPTINDFGESQSKLVERYTKYMDTDIKEMAYLLAYLGKWTTEDVLKIKEKTNVIKLSITDYNDFIGHSFVIKDDETFYMTKIVQESFYNNIPEILKDEFHKLMYLYILEKVKDEGEELNIVENLTKLVNEFLRSIPEPNKEEKEKLQDLCDKIRELYGKGLLDDEFILIDKLYKYYENKNDEFIEEKLITKEELAIAYERLGKHNEELKLNEEVYEKRKEMLGENNIKTLNSLYNLGGSYLNIGELTEAIKLITITYDCLKKVLGENNTNALSTLSTLALCYLEKGDYAKSLELNKIAYEKSKEILGEDHETTLTILNNLARCYDELDENKKAIELYEFVYKNRKEILGENHPDTLYTLNNLVCAYDFNGENEKTIELEKGLYESAKEVMGEFHPFTLITLNNLASSYGDLGDNTKALNLKQEVYEREKEILGENHPNTLAALTNLASTYSDIGDSTKAQELFKEAYQKKKEVLGKNHPDTLRTLSNLAITYKHIGDDKVAIDLQKTAYELTKNILGENNEETLIMLHNLAYFYEEIGEKEKALELFNKLYEKKKERLGENHKDTLKIKSKIDELNRENP